MPRIGVCMNYCLVGIAVPLRNSECSTLLFFSGITMNMSNPEIDYYQIKVENFNERKQKYPDTSRIEVYFVNAELDNTGVKFSVWKESGVTGPKFIMLPSAYVLKDGILKPRRLTISKGKSITLEVVCFKQDIELAKSICKEAIQDQINKQKAELKFLEEILTSARM